MLLSTFVLVYSLVSEGCYGFSLPFRRQEGITQSRSEGSGLALGDLWGNIYIGQVQVADQTYTVQLDTGSSDFWIDPSVLGSQPEGAYNTGVTTSICYIDRTCAMGEIITAPVQFGDFVIPWQAMIDAQGSNATFGGSLSGLLGLGGTPTSASVISSSLKDRPEVNGRTLLDNLFSLYADQDNFITFLLSRSNYSGDLTDGGVLSIRETVPGFENILTMPKLGLALPDSWAIAIDGITVNGGSYTSKTTTTAKGLQPKQLVALIDTGTSRAQAPPEFVDAMYKDLAGAVFNGKDAYTLPCDSKINVSIIIGNQSFPVHPIDVVAMMYDDEPEKTDEVLCKGTFSHLAETGQSWVDVILGATFLRNAYSLYDFGTWTDVTEDQPYIQLMSVTNASHAWLEFDSLNQARLSSVKGSSSLAGSKQNAAQPLISSGLFLGVFSTLTSLIVLR